MWEGVVAVLFGFDRRCALHVDDRLDLSDVRGRGFVDRSIVRCMVWRQTAGEGSVGAWKTTLFWIPQSAPESSSPLTVDSSEGTPFDAKSIKNP